MCSAPRPGAPGSSRSAGRPRSSSHSPTVQDTVANLSDTVKQSAQKLPDPVAGVVNAVADSVKGSTASPERDNRRPRRLRRSDAPDLPTTPDASAAVSRRLAIGCDFVHRSSFDVSAVFQVEPVADQVAEVVDAEWSMEPETPVPHLRRPLRQPVPPADHPVRPIGDHLPRDGGGAGRGGGGRRGRSRAPRRPAAGRDTDLHPAQPLLPARRAGPRGLEPVRHPAAGLPAGAGHLRLRATTT